MRRERDFDGRERDRERLRKRLRGARGSAATEEAFVQQQEPLPGTTLPALNALMRMTYEDWDEWTRGSTIRRAGYVGFMRNVAVGLGNWGSEVAVPTLVSALADPEPLIRGHAAWALGEIDSMESVAALEAAWAVERDSFVVEELDGALNRLRSRVK